MGNSRGSYRSSRHNMMAAFDKLPPTARRALADAAFNWAPQPIRTRHNRGARGFATGSDIAATVARWDETQIAKDRKHIWGIQADTSTTAHPSKKPGNRATRQAFARAKAKENKDDRNTRP